MGVDFFGLVLKRSDRNRKVRALIFFYSTQKMVDTEGRKSMFPRPRALCLAFPGDDCQSTGIGMYESAQNHRTASSF